MTRPSERWNPPSNMASLTAPELSTSSAPPFSKAAKDKAEQVPAPPDFAIYIHWPFCQTKCPYCDFNSYARRSISEEEWLQAALRELNHYASLTPERLASSIFLGGGTPSLMPPATVGLLLEKIAGLWPVAPGVEITLEANPSSVEASRFAGYRAAGVNRVSIGVQSFNDNELRSLGRLHSADEARQALAVAENHFERMSFDLIYARPGQTIHDWRAELGEALDRAQGHLSLYQLTIEPGTVFFELERSGKLRVPEGEDAARLYELTQELCEARGLPAYEVSNHATPGQESRHNLTYWRYGDYAGIGPGAHGRLTVDGRKIATVAERNPALWAARVSDGGYGVAEQEEIGRQLQAEEMLLMGLRLREGLNLEALQARTGYALSLSSVLPLVSEGFLEAEAHTIRATRKGVLVLNTIIEMLAEALTPCEADRTTLIRTVLP